MSKPKVLWISESSFLNTGFSVLSHGILSRLYNTEKYELCEFGSYGSSRDMKSLSVPWQFYGTRDNKWDRPNPNNQNSIYTQFGEYDFENVCLDFQPDIVIDTRDHWMISYQARSPFRQNYKLLWGPTVDGSPQKTEWLEDYAGADRIFTYSKFGKEVLEKESGGKIKVSGVFAPGVDVETFYPIKDRDGHRQRFGIGSDVNIILTVMRNQKRKLYPDLIDAFETFLNMCKDRGKDDVFNNTYLHLHTSYPDVGWDLPRYILESRYPDKILVTYKCNKCEHFYLSAYTKEVNICSKCGNLSAHMPNTGDGVTRQELNAIYNLADLYVQYSTCEGLGMGISEAKACKVPTLAVEYSAMKEQTEEPGGSPIPVERFFYESILETEQQRALPDNYETAKLMFKHFCTKDQKTITKEKEEGYEYVRANYSFDRSAKVIEEVIDSVELLDHSLTWQYPQPRLMKWRDHPREMSPEQAVDFYISIVLNKPHLLQSYWRSSLVKSLLSGRMVVSNSSTTYTKFGMEECISYFKDIVIKNNTWENNRVDIANKTSKSLQYVVM